jgi:hypothetical protein
VVDWTALRKNGDGDMGEVGVGVAGEGQGGFYFRRRVEQRLHTKALWMELGRRLVMRVEAAARRAGCQARCRTLFRAIRYLLARAVMM